MSATRFAGRRVLVTGAASGIGRATSFLLGREGADLCLADIDTTGLAQTAKLLGRTAAVLPYDAADLRSCRAMVEEAGQPGLDIVINIAGILRWGPTADFEDEAFDQMMRVNATSVYAICRAALPRLVKSRGNIVCIASTAGQMGIAYSAAYSASKHAVVGLVKSLALEYASRGVRVNAVCPGQVDTPMTRASPPEGIDDWPLVMRNAPKLADGVCRPEDIAEAIAFLASDAACKATGTLLTIDGGQSAG